jgi:hypothetical protein
LAGVNGEAKPPDTIFPLRGSVLQPPPTPILCYVIVILFVFVLRGLPVVVLRTARFATLFPLR